MKISELIKKLERDLEWFGDLDVKYLNSQMDEFYDAQYTSPINEQGFYDCENTVALEIY